MRAGPRSPPARLLQSAPPRGRGRRHGRRAGSRLAAPRSTDREAAGLQMRWAGTPARCPLGCRLAGREEQPGDAPTEPLSGTGRGSSSQNVCGGFGVPVHPALRLWSLGTSGTQGWLGEPAFMDVDREAALLRSTYGEGAVPSLSQVGPHSWGGGPPSQPAAQQRAALPPLAALSQEAEAVLAPLEQRIRKNLPVSAAASFPRAHSLNTCPAMDERIEKTRSYMQWEIIQPLHRDSCHRGQHG